MSSLVGRERELPALAARLEFAPVLTLIGPPGVGKSRLAAHLATASARRSVVVDLDHAGARQLELGLVGPSTLVVLDNCDVALNECRQFVTNVVGRWDGLSILATSRERLGLTIESVWYVQPLAIPVEGAADLAAIAACPSVSLFVDRAQAADARFALTGDNAADIARICRELDGLPLALELAAARADVLTPRSLAERLDTAIRLVPSQLAGMGSSLARSVERLRLEEQRLLWSLSVFDGPWDLPAAEAVCADRSATSDVASLLTRLVACSLVQRLDQPHATEMRYTLPKVVRRFALQQLELMGGSRAARRRHAEWCRQVVESIPYGTGEADAIERLRGALPTLVAALAWAVDADEVDTALSLANVLHGLWFITGQFTASRAWFDRVLALKGGSRTTRAMVTNWASNHAMAQGDHQAALALSARARAEAAEMEDPVLRAISLDGLAVIHWEQGRIDQAEALFVEELELCLDLGLTWLQCASLYRLAGIQVERGLLEYAQELAELALIRLGDDANVWMQLRVLDILGRVALERGDLGTADEHLSSALEMASRIEDTRGICDVRVDLAQLESERDNVRAARRHLTDALDLCDQSGEALAFIRVLDGVVALRALARPEAALHLAGAIANLRSQYGVQRPPLAQSRHASALETASMQLRRTTGEIAMAAGQSLSPEAATRLARDLLATAEPGVQVSEVGAGPLTRRELEIATLVARGLTNRAIGAELFIAEGTVRAHVEHILAKLGLKSRVEVAGRLP